MAIKAGQIVVGNSPPSKQEQTKPVGRTVRHIQKEEDQQINQIKKTNGDHVLIVDGKPKKISKKSAYLLDMITSDSDG